VIDTIPAIVFEVGPDGSPTFANRRWLEYTGSPPRQPGRIDPDDQAWRDATCVHPEDLGEYVTHWQRALAEGRPFESETRVRRADGEYRWFLARHVPFRDEQGEIRKWFGTLTDIEDRKQTEQERVRLRQLEADLAHINRVSMLGELTASIAHEVNQPLSGVVSNGGACLRWLAGDVPDLDEAREAAKRIVRDGKRAGEIITRIRALTRRREVPKEPLDLNELIRAVLALVSDQVKRHGVILRTDLAPDVFPVLGDQVQLQQVVLNLIMNAIDAMSTVRDRARELVLTTRNIDPDQVQASVEDSGIGLDPNTKAKMFESFYTTKPGGMGMGLAICRSILQAHGGRLWATTKAGPGTAFCFALPKYAQENVDSRDHGSLAGV
jgi:PAS domain S-box-containing protein